MNTHLICLSPYRSMRTLEPGTCICSRTEQLIKFVSFYKAKFIVKHILTSKAKVSTWYELGVVVTRISCSYPNVPTTRVEK